jgi:S1-C subfamily serine protease
MKHDKFDYHTPWERGTYQTGSTKPPKSRGALVAVLLILVIFLAGVSSILGMMNIRLFSALNSQSTIPFALCDNTPTTLRTIPNTFPCEQPGIAISAEPVSPLYQHYYHLPAGLFINAVIEGSNAAQQGLSPGDILISLDGNPMTSNEDLTNFLSNCQVGDTVEAIIYRNNGHHNLTLTIEIAN